MFCSRTTKSNKKKRICKHRTRETSSEGLSSATLSEILNSEYAKTKIGFQLRPKDSYLERSLRSLKFLTICLTFLRLRFKKITWRKKLGCKQLSRWSRCLSTSKTKSLKSAQTGSKMQRKFLHICNRGKRIDALKFHFLLPIRCFFKPFWWSLWQLTA